MTDIIDFLEKLGQDAQLRHADCGEIREALADARIDKTAAAAILAGDERTLARHLGARTDLNCLIFAPRRAPGEEPDKEPEKEGDVPEQDAPDDNGPKSQNSRRVA